MVAGVVVGVPEQPGLRKTAGQATLGLTTLRAERHKPPGSPTPSLRMGLDPLETTMGSPAVGTEHFVYPPPDPQPGFMAA